MNKYTNLIRLALGFLLFTTYTQYSYIYQVHYMINKQTGKQIYLLLDYHEDAEISTIQRITILNAAKKYSSHLLVEDQSFLMQHLSSTDILAYQPCLQPLIDDLIQDPINFDPNKPYNEDFSVLDPEYEGDSTPLYLLTHMARTRGIKSTSIECRQAEVISILGGPISARNVCKRYEKMINDIQHYNDGPIFNNYYEEQLAKYAKYSHMLKPFFDYLYLCDCNLKNAFKNKSFKQLAQSVYQTIRKDSIVEYYLQQGLSIEKAEQKALVDATTEEYIPQIYQKIMTTLYLSLINIEILHKIATNTIDKSVIVYAGGDHINSVIPILAHDGYRMTYQSNGLFDVAVNLEECFQTADICKNSCIHSSKHYSENYYLTLLTSSPNLSNIDEQKAVCFA